MKKLVKFHFLILILIGINFITFSFLHYELKYEIKYVLIIILYLTGIILFFGNIKSFKAKILYFLIFPLTIVSFGLFYLFGGILLALIGGILITPLYPEFSEYSKNGIELYPKYTGFLARCCLYKVNENHGIFEENLGTILLDSDSKPPNSKIKLINQNTIEIRYKDYQNKEQIEYKKLEN
ncbi:hypothetical protein [Epilithonimonas sp.]|uniref:hypothetical protein n=1 Tax=Epilithonimonas sp. TaxID=2894511 RepID=UPI0028ACC412|nr:hypothetical protein [Epilithonimonas sp.]